MSIILSWKHVTTRNDHSCWGCCKMYPPKTKMVRASYIDGGSFHTIYWCKVCEEYAKRHLGHDEECGRGEIYENDKETWELILKEMEGK